MLRYLQINIDIIYFLITTLYTKTLTSSLNVYYALIKSYLDIFAVKVSVKPMSLCVHLVWYIAHIECNGCRRHCSLVSKLSPTGSGRQNQGTRNRESGTSPTGRNTEHVC